jgi:LacI family transcriptional regulator
VLVEPGGVIQRRSTSFYAIEDALVSRAMRYIWERACEGIQVGEVVEHVNCSRRGLEVRFKKSIGRSIGSEIGRARISHARTLLTETKLSLAEIAQACGYQWQAQFTKVFRQIAGETPSAYRKRLLSSS